MFKKKFIILSILAVYALDAMEPLRLDAKLIPTAQEKICHLAKLLPDIRNYIAFFAFETESKEECIKRTRIQDRVPSVCYKDFVTPFNIGMGCQSYTAAFCPNKTHVAVLEFLYGRTEPMLTIIDIINNKAVHKEKIAKPTSRAVTLSLDADRVAIMQIGAAATNFADVLVIKNVSTKKIQEIVIPATFLKISEDVLGFNKQGTHIIVHNPIGTHLVANSDGSISAPKTNLSLPYLIFPLEIDIQQRKTSQKGLEEYFKQRRICKEFANSI